MSFEQSSLYKKALAEYQETIYKDILNPINSVILNDDEVYLFYPQHLVEDIKKQMVDIYNDEDNKFPVNLWCETPIIRQVSFMNIIYRAICLWYDGWDVPNKFNAKLN